MKSAATKKFINKAGQLLLDLVLRRVKGKKPEQVERIGERYGRFMWRFAGKRKKRTIDNLKLAFPEKTEQEIERIAQGVFLHFGRTTADFLAGDGRSQADIEASTKIVGRNHLDQAMAKGKGSLLITGHLGNWERCSAWMSLAGYPLNVIARDADDEGVNTTINQIRQKPGTKVIPRGQAARQVLLKLRANEIVGILPDQNASDIFIPFFGHPAGTALGPGVFASRTGATIVPVTCVYNSINQYTMTFFPPITADDPNDTSGESMMRAINQWLEEEIAKTPEQWLWMHDRWRNARKRGLL
jgi:KDO2-lipid IV(A) lauroyltransferase